MKPRPLPALLALCLAAASAAFAADAAPAGAPAVINELLVDYLAHNFDPARYEKFLADDFVQTNYRGEVLTKAEILKDLRSIPPPPPDAELTIYTAEDINIRPYNGFATLTFRLVARNHDGTVDNFRSSLTLVFRDGRWQVLLWQDTTAPAPQPAK